MFPAKNIQEKDNLFISGLQVVLPDWLPGMKKTQFLYP